MDQMGNVGFWLTSVTLCIALLVAAYVSSMIRMCSAQGYGLCPLVGCPDVDTPKRSDV